MNTRRYRPENAIFAKNLKYYIALSGKDQKQICADLDMPEASMSEYVNAKSLPRLKTIQTIANYFGVLIADLMEEREKNTANEQRKLLEKEWGEHFAGVVFTVEEITALMEYADFLVAKRNK